MPTRTKRRRRDHLATVAALLAIAWCMGCTVDDAILPPGDPPPLPDSGVGDITEVGDTGGSEDVDDADDSSISPDGADDGDAIGDSDSDTDFSDDPCDLTGLWAVKGEFYALDTAFTSRQLSNNWFLLEIVDSGRDIEIVGGFDCGIRVEGAASVTITEATTEALRQRNSQVGRRGISVLEGDRCLIEFERWFWVRGGKTSLLPDDFRAYHEPDALDRLQLEKPLPTSDNPGEAEDTENSGALGMAYQVGGAVSGTRNVVQRDWNEYFSNDDYTVGPAGLDSFVLGARFDVAEELFSVTGCEGGDFACGLLSAGSSADAEGDHRVRFVRVDADTFPEPIEIDTCYKVQDTIPWGRP